MDWYRIGRGSLGVDSDDLALRERFRLIYGGCRTTEPGTGPSVICRARAIGHSARWLVEFDDPEPLDTASFAADVFPGRDIRFAHPNANDGEALEVHGESLIAPPGVVWQHAAANLAVSRVIRLQRDVLFFHGASVGIGGAGILACGPKRAGKTTLATTLGRRGHALLGDELAAVHLPTLTLLPCRRSLSVRDGPAAEGTHDVVAAAGAVRELYPDGETRSVISPDAFTGGATEVRLTIVLLLRRFAVQPSAERVALAPALFGHLTPLAASLWQRARPMLVMQLLRALRDVPIYWLDAGTPDATAPFVERLVEDSCR